MPAAKCTARSPSMLQIFCSSALFGGVGGWTKSSPDFTSFFAGVSQSRFLQAKQAQCRRSSKGRRRQDQSKCNTVTALAMWSWLRMRAVALLSESMAAQMEPEGRSAKLWQCWALKIIAYGHQNHFQYSSLTGAKKWLDFKVLFNKWLSKFSLLNDGEVSLLNRVSHFFWWVW